MQLIRENSSEFPQTNKKVMMNVIDIVRLRDGKFIEHWGILDMQNLMQQIAN